MCRRFLFWMGCGMLFALTACDDASTVGLDLVGEQGEPEVVRLAPSLFEPVPFEDITGAASRVLAGTVDDPLLGRLAATGYLDFAGSFGQVDDSTVQRVNVFLAPNYVFGDTTQTVTLALRAILEDWSGASAPADTTLPTDATVLSEATFLPTDTLVTVPLPDDWVAGRDFASDTFSEAFHGFAFETTSTSAVVGFRTSGAELQIITPTDTVTFAAAESLTRIERQTAPSLPDGLALYQDGGGPTLRFAFDLTPFEETPLNGAYLLFHADTLALDDAPAGFVRPQAQQLALVAVDADDDDATLTIGQATLAGDTLRFQPNALRQLFQRSFFGEDLFDYFELRPTAGNNTLDALLLRTPSSPDEAPEAVLTISPAD